MKKRSPAEWLDWYVEHGGSRDLELDERETVLSHPEHGFATMLAHGDILELHHLCGDGKYWQVVLVEIMKAHGLKKLRAFTRRNPQAWMRKYGGRIRGYYMEADLEELELPPGLTPHGAPSVTADAVTPPSKREAGSKWEAREKDVISSEV